IRRASELCASMYASLRRLRTLLFCALASVALYGASCTSEKGTATGGGQKDPGIPELADVIYLDGTNDESLAQLLARSPLDAPDKGSAIISPQQGARLPASHIPTFAWQKGSWASGGDRDPSPRTRRAWAELFGPERMAHAHGPSVNGTAYFLAFTAQ